LHYFGLRGGPEMADKLPKTVSVLLYFTPPGREDTPETIAGV